MELGETPEERRANEARQAIGDLVAKDMVLQMDERFAYQAGNHEEGAEIRSRRGELALMILDAEAEYLRLEIAAQEAHRKLMHDILDSQSKGANVSLLASARAGIDREIDNKIETAEFQLEQNREQKKEAMRTSQISLEG